MARIALYVENNFMILNDQGPMNLKLIGAELVGNYIYIYQELKQPLEPNVFIKNEILREIYPLQINQVNMINEENIRTLMFTENETMLPYFD
jgi:hypothetical protein|tara:strand:+ start:1448 stop:1723 length:276 start_codon:yes stop_codon:yes gene_type:complete